MKLITVWTTCTTLLASTQALQVDLTSATSIKQTASQIAFDLMSIYTGNRTGDVPGNLPAPFFWWEAGAMFGTMINYWHLTGDTTYNNVTSQAMLFQVGPAQNYMPPNQSSSEGNDDQAFWGMSAMMAAEYNFPNPPSDQPQWLALAQGVFNSQTPRWDPTTCGGGMHWQIVPFNKGFDYKNSIANGGYFNIGARLARYTGNDTYAQLAERTWDWMEKIGFIDSKYNVYDGAGVPNCDQLTKLQWTYNVGILLHGAANMYNYTNGSAIWQQRTQGLLDATQLFFSNPGAPDIMVEVACENNNVCNNDQNSFKAYLSRWMAATTQLAPFTTNYVKQKLAGSAVAAAQQCSGGSTGTKCGLKWFQGAQWDGTTGPGQQMAALEVVQTNMMFLPQNPVNKAPLTDVTGGTSQGNPNAGTAPLTWTGQSAPKPITAADRAGAAFLTIFLVAIFGSGAFWVHTTGDDDMKYQLQHQLRYKGSVDA